MCYFRERGGISAGSGTNLDFWENFMLFLCWERWWTDGQGMDPDGTPQVLGQTPCGSGSRLGGIGMGVTILLILIFFFFA